MTSNIFPEIPEASIFDHKVDLFIKKIIIDETDSCAYSGTNQLVILEQTADQLLKKSDSNPVCFACTTFFLNKNG